MEDLKKKIQVAVDALKNQRFKEAENLTKKLIKEITERRLSEADSVGIINFLSLYFLF